jgi:hypothetical protein
MLKVEIGRSSSQWVAVARTRRRTNLPQRAQRNAKIKRRDFKPRTPKGFGAGRCELPRIGAMPLATSKRQILKTENFDFGHERSRLLTITADSSRFRDGAQGAIGIYRDFRKSQAGATESTSRQPRKVSGQVRITANPESVRGRCLRHVKTEGRISNRG